MTITDLSFECPEKILSATTHWRVNAHGVHETVIRFPAVFAVAYFQEFARLGLSNAGYKAFASLTVEKINATLDWIENRS